jgi:hypothetical protein
VAVVGNLPKLPEIWSWWSTPEVLQENHGVGVCSTFLEQTCGEVAGTGCVWQEKFGTKLIFWI